MLFLPFVYGYLSSCQHAHCTPNKSVPTLRYTHRHWPIYIQLHARRHIPSAVPWISEDHLLHTTRVQWLCSEAENSAVCSCHCETPRVHLKLRCSTSVHMMIIIICCGYCKFPPCLLHFSFVCTHAYCSCKIYQFLANLTVYHSFSVCSVPLGQSFTW